MKHTILGLFSALCFLLITLPIRAADVLDKAPSQYAKLGDIRVHYKSIGAGKSALVLVHGWSCNMTFWRQQVPAFDGKVRMILVDLPGHGQSDKPKVEYSMALFGKAVNAVMEDAGVEEAVLAGHSMGTPVVRQFYRLYPKKTLALIAVDGTFRNYITDAEQEKQFLSMFSGPNYEQAVERFVESMFTEATNNELRELIKTSMLNTPQHVALGAMKGMFARDIWKEDKIDVPVQVILAPNIMWGDDYESYIRSLAPKLEFHTMKGVSHFLHMEKPDEFNQIMLAFLRKHGALNK